MSEKISLDSSVSIYIVGRKESRAYFCCGTKISEHSIASCNKVPLSFLKISEHQSVLCLTSTFRPRIAAILWSVALKNSSL